MRTVKHIVNEWTPFFFWGDHRSYCGVKIWSVGGDYPQCKNCLKIVRAKEKKEKHE